MGALRANITDRALRYRANQAIPEHRHVCAFCGATSGLEVGHLDGHEENNEPENLTWTCRPCNVVVANVMRNAGLGRLTRQYNPSKSGGASSIGEWMQAVGAITPHTDRGDRGLASSMSVSDAVAMIRATPHHKRSEFAQKLKHSRRNPTRRNMWPFGEGQPLGPRHYTYDLEAAREAGREERRSKPKIVARYRGYTISKTPDGEYFSSLDRDSWFESLTAMKRFIDDWKKGQGKNPAKFDRCVKAVKKRGGAYDPYAVCTAAGTRRNSSTSDLEDYHRSLAEDWRRGGTSYFNTRSEALQLATFLRRYGVAVRMFREGSEWVVTNERTDKRNPATAAAEGFEEFHGYPPDEIVSVEKRVHFHKHLSGAGKLKALTVKGVDHQTHTIKGFGPALLAFNEAKNQLFVEGGDQGLDLRDFGITEPHELETLGKVLAIDYFTDKTHLGEDGGRATYAHEFRTTNENGQHVTVTIARYPDLIYRVLDEQLEFSGGSYTIRAEGIDL